MISPRIPVPLKYLDHFKEYVALYYHIVNVTIEQWVTGFATAESIYSTQQFVTAMSFAAEGRRLFTTQHTHIGLGPPGIEKRDNIRMFGTREQVDTSW